MENVVRKEDEDKLLVAHFNVNSRLLEELGERLVSTPTVALTEVVKNAYDADATQCVVAYDAIDNRLSITDDGHGMTEVEFLNNWMTIATGNKEAQRFSRVLERPLTGEKGIGRFAAKFLGKHLTLSSTAFDEESKKHTRLTAYFEWDKLKGLGELSELEIEYEVVEIDASDAKTGTVLLIQGVSVDVRSKLSEIKTKLLGLVSTYDAFDKEKASKVLGLRRFSSDGFSIKFKGFGEGLDEQFTSKLFDQAFGKVEFYLKDSQVTYKVSLGGKVNRYKYPYENNIGTPVYGELFFFPRRAGVFKDTGVNGKEAARWVKENSGVALYDRGFKLSPYGEETDDWLNLAVDNARSARDWRSSLMLKHHAIPEHIKKKPKENWALFLPTNQQLIGAVFISSKHSKKNDGLIASVNREGFIKNDAFSQLRDIVRTACELLALQDKLKQQEDELAKAQEAREDKRQELQAAIAQVEQSDSLSALDKSRIIATYKRYYDDIDELENYDRNARRNLEAMSLLGAVAGFMTHEYQSIMFALEKLTTELSNRFSQDPSIRNIIEEIESCRESFGHYYQYTNNFITNDKELPKRPFLVSSQLKKITNSFGQFAHQRNIEIEVDSGKSRLSTIPVALFSGVVLNLYSNALKAILADPNMDSESKIKFQVIEEEKFIYIDVLDTGIGISEEVEDRIWDPLYTTTSNHNNPLGSGMGMGLSLVKNIVDSVKGASIKLHREVPEPFVTCFRLTLRK